MQAIANKNFHGENKLKWKPDDGVAFLRILATKFFFYKDDKLIGFRRTRF